MNKFIISAVIGCDTAEQAVAVSSERFGYDDGESPFDYSLTPRSIVTLDSRRQTGSRDNVDRLQLKALRTATGDSNDAEIEALQEALDAALSLLGGEWSRPTDDEDDCTAVTVDGVTIAQSRHIDITTGKATP